MNETCSQVSSIARGAWHSNALCKQPPPHLPLEPFWTAIASRRGHLHGALYACSTHALFPLWISYCSQVIVHWWAAILLRLQSLGKRPKSISPMAKVKRRFANIHATQQGAASPSRPFHESIFHPCLQMTAASFSRVMAIFCASQSWYP